MTRRTRVAAGVVLAGAALLASASEGPAPSAAVDPAARIWITVAGKNWDARLVEQRGGRTVTVAHPFEESASAETFGTVGSLAYGHRYTVLTGRKSLTFATRPLPAGFLRRSWRFESMTTAERAAFVRIVGRGPPLLHAILREIDGAVSVSEDPHACDGADACANERNGVVRIGLGRVVPFMVMHELGHAVWDLGLDEAGIDAFASAFSRSPRLGPGCCPLPYERFADQFAMWALGGIPGGAHTYGESPLLPRAEFGRLLALEYAYRPVSGGGLPR